jgi:DNA processing protein
MTQTNADKPNFVRRNRIVAGMADATILIESGAKGGGLITADIAQSYARSVFAFPGNVGQPCSEGCNNLIRDNGAGLITNAEDFVKAMGWPTMKDMPLWLTPSSSVESAQIPDITPEEQQVISLLQQTNDLQLNIITVKTGIPIGRLTALLFQLEMKSVVKPLAGGMYHLML